MDYAQANQAARDYSFGAKQVEEDRPIARAMTDLASTIGDLETAARELARRVAPLIPGGSPFERTDKLASMQNAAVNATPPAAVRSNFCDQIEARTYQLRELTLRINEAIKGVEI